MDSPHAAGVMQAEPARRELELRWSSDAARLATLRAEWNPLLARSAADTVFLTWEWIDTWWRHFGAGQALWLGELRDAAGTLRGIAPLKLRRRSGRLGAFRAVEFIGAAGPALPDHLDVILERGWEDAGFDAVMRGLEARSAEWDLLVLSDLDEDPFAPDGAAARVTRWARDRRRWMQRHRSTVCPYLALPATWEELLGTLRGGLQRNVPYQTRRCQKRGGRLVAFEAPEDLDTGLAELTRLHQLRMEKTERGGNFRNPAYAAFHHELMRVLARNGWLELRFLEVEGKNIAVEYGFRYGRKLYGYQLGFDPEWSSLSPGMVILAMRLRELIGEGYTELDMLRGRGAYKSNWTQRYREGVTCIIPQRGPRGARAFLGELLALPPPLLAKRILPASAFESLYDARRRRKSGPRLSSRGGGGASGSAGGRGATGGGGAS